jgi:hypothetical protein
MSIVTNVATAAKVVTSSYKILATLIFSYFLIKETIRRERDG